MGPRREERMAFRETRGWGERAYPCLVHHHREEYRMFYADSNAIHRIRNLPVGTDRLGRSYSLHPGKLDHHDDE